jgi:hypothetical protein
MRIKERFNQRGELFNYGEEILLGVVYCENGTEEKWRKVNYEISVITPKLL